VPCFHVTKGIAHQINNLCRGVLAQIGSFISTKHRADDDILSGGRVSLISWKKALPVMFVKRFGNATCGIL
jgi:hypothetical protein